MSFSTETKKELSEINNLNKKEEIKYELMGYLQSSNIQNKKEIVKYSTENEYNINRFAKLLRNVGSEDFKIDIQGKVYIITIKKGKIEKYIEKPILIDVNEKNIKAFLRGLFLGSGSINNPQNNYHLEIKVSNGVLIKEIIQALNEYSIIIKSIEGSIYIKDGEEISKFLAFIGAKATVLRFEEIRVEREMNNKINRLVNCKTANLNKTINASVEQISAIKKLKESGKYNMIDKSLQELAELRLEYPNLPLIELGQRLSVPIGKSGVNYRMKKIIELSK